MEAIAAALAIAIMVLSIMCRLNFGKGLVQRLNAQDELIDKNGYEDDNFAPVSFGTNAQDPEKLEPPSIASLPKLQTIGMTAGNVDVVSLQRSDSASSDRSVDAYLPYNSQSTLTRSDTQGSQKKRWAIE